MYSDLYDKRIAVAVMSFNRPEYLKRNLRALEGSVDKQKVDWIFFQDGAVNRYSDIKHGDESNIQKNIELLKSADLPHKSIRVNSDNLGSAIQTDKCFSLLDEEYDIVIRVEEDMVLSKYFIRVALSMLDQFPETIPSLYREGSIMERNLPEDLDKVEYKWSGSFAVSAMTGDVFQNIQPRWDEFRDIIYGVDWWVGQRPDIREEYDGDIPNAWDGVMNSIINEENYIRVSPVVSRSSHIGKHGMNVNPNTYDDRFGDEGKLDYERDANPGSWEIA